MSAVGRRGQRCCEERDCGTDRCIRSTHDRRNDLITSMAALDARGRVVTCNPPHKRGQWILHSPGQDRSCRRAGHHVGVALGNGGHRLTRDAGQLFPTGLSAFGSHLGGPSASRALLEQTDQLRRILRVWALSPDPWPPRGETARAAPNRVAQRLDTAFARPIAKYQHGSFGRGSPKSSGQAAALQSRATSGRRPQTHRGTLRPETDPAESRDARRADAGQSI
jgi:hypothetical protein